MTKPLIIMMVGVSTLENLTNPAKLNRKESIDYKKAWRDVLERFDVSVNTTLTRDLTQIAGLYADLDLGNENRRSWATAELASAYLMRRDASSNRRSPLFGRDLSQARVVMLCSDTGEGAFCGLLNAMMLAREVRCFKSYERDLFNQGPTKIIDGFDNEILPSALKEIRLPQITLMVVNDLDPQKPERFEKKALPNLIELIAQLHYGQEPGQRRSQPTLINYSGGYKATVPALTQAAALAGNMELACLFEGGSELICHPVLPQLLEPAIEKRLLQAGTGTNLDVLAKYSTQESLEQGLEAEERIFYQEQDTGHGIELSLLGSAAKKMLDAKSLYEDKNKER